MEDIIPPEDIAEMFAVIREANRLMREGGTVAERMAHDERRTALLARLEAREAPAIQRATERAKAALRERGAL